MDNIPGIEQKSESQKYPNGSFDAPPLYNPYGSDMNGPPVPLRICGYVLPERILELLVEEYNILPDEPDMDKRVGNFFSDALLTLNARGAVVPNKKAVSGESLCVVLGSNASERDMRFAMDENRIKEYQRILLTEQRPRWFRCLGM